MSRGQLIARLALEGHRAAVVRHRQHRAARLDALRPRTGALTGVYPPGHGEALREDWPECWTAGGPPAQADRAQRLGGDGGTGYVMQGDNNPEIDRWTPTDDEVLGKAVLHVPGAGNAVMLVRQVLITPPFPYLLAGFVFLVIVLGGDKKNGRPEAGDNQSAEQADTQAEPPSSTSPRSG